MKKQYDQINSVTLLVGSGEWSALYVNGDLDTYGDHYLSDERIRELFGVEVVWNEDWLRKDESGHLSKVAASLPEYRAWQQENAEIQAKADALRAEAQQLLDAADRVERSKK